MLFKVEVTQKDISGGRPQRCSICPAALAVKRALKDVAVEVEIMELETRAYLRVPGKPDGWRGLSVTVDSPPELVQFVRDFDAHRSVGPLTFELDLPLP